MGKYWPQMVKYCLLYGEVLASGLVNSGLEMLPENFGTVMERKIKQKPGFVHKAEDWQEF
jgi:hypothetical protein